MQARKDRRLFQTGIRNAKTRNNLGYRRFAHCAITAVRHTVSPLKFDPFKPHTRRNGEILPDKSVLDKAGLGQCPSLVILDNNAVSRIRQIAVFLDAFLVLKVNPETDI